MQIDMKETNEQKISATIKKFGSQIVLNKVQELYIDDPSFDNFCLKFESIFNSGFKEMNKKEIKLFDKHNEKKSLDKYCFVHLCVEHDFRYNLKQLGYHRRSINVAKKTITGLLPKVPIHSEYLEKINKFEKLCQK